MIIIGTDTVVSVMLESAGGDFFFDATIMRALPLAAAGLGTETLLERGLLSSGCGVLGRNMGVLREATSGDGDREWSEEESINFEELAGERCRAGTGFVGVTRDGWGRLLRSERGEPLKGEATFLLLLRAMSRHFLDLELVVRVVELSGVTAGLFSDNPREVMVKSNNRSLKHKKLQYLPRKAVKST